MGNPGVVLIAGLGNPGDHYAKTRHNAGFWFMEHLKRKFDLHFSVERKFTAETAQFRCAGHPVRAALPHTFMNSSGQSIAALASYYRIEPTNILVVHDELDLPPGCVRLKTGGGHGGHNGLRDILRRLDSRDFLRLRLGIGHPGTGKDVTGHVLTRPKADERARIEAAIDRSIEVLPRVVAGEYARAMSVLHHRPERQEAENGN
ncbi:MAG: aminoacyl-tRNA hydrolase [Gammaproteobacteria bacterium]|nr:aminoacyl-tRNA hydrolase [Gammaproteobacteria bacterium]